MRGLVFKLLLYFIRKLIAVSLARRARHSYPAERINAALKRRVRLQSHYYFVVAVYVTGRIRQKRRNALRIHVEHAALVAFRL